MDTYFGRVADKILADELSGMGAVLVQGPKWCGKTLIAEGKATLKALSDKIDTTKMSKPMFRMILVANGEFA